MSLYLSVRLFVGQHISGTVHYVIIIFFMGGPNFQKKGGLTGPQPLKGGGVFEGGLRP